MKLTIAQDHEYVGSDYWKWRVWIEGAPEDLERVESVKWFLHPSFPRSVVVSSDRSTGFRLETSGWGTFTLRAEVQGVDGTVQLLRKPLQLFYPDQESAAKAQLSRPPGAATMATGVAKGVGQGAGVGEVASQSEEQGVRRVFLSYAAADRRSAMAIRFALEAKGMTVLDDTAISAGEPWELATLDLLNGADATVAYISSELPSAFVAQEINASIKSGKPTLVVSSEDLGTIAGVSPDTQVLRLDPSDASGVGEAISKLANASKAL